MLNGRIGGGVLEWHFRINVQGALVSTYALPPVELGLQPGSKILIVEIGHLIA